VSRLPAPRKWQAPAVAHDARAKQAAAAVLHAALDQARANACGAAESPNSEYLHQLRVGLRRYRSALRVFRALLRKGPRKRLAREARDAMRPLGEARDWDVCLEWLQRAKAPEALLRRVRGRRDAARRNLRVPRLDALAPDQTVWKAKPESLRQYRVRALGKTRRKVAKRLRGIDWDEPAQRHRLRIAVKRLRYAIGFLGGDEPKALEDLQDVLGELNDIAVARRLLADLLPPSSVLRKLDAAERRLIAASGRQTAALDLED